jgi:6-pyruvoyl-tetrahydropterin synthase
MSIIYSATKHWRTKMTLEEMDHERSRRRRMPLVSREIWDQKQTERLQTEISPFEEAKKLRTMSILGMPSITLRHNIEVAHRMYEMPGKCQQIHGHSMWVDMWLFGELNSNGVLEGLEFGAVKKRFRAWLDNTFDHHLLLNERDPWAQKLRPSFEFTAIDHATKASLASEPNLYSQLPGLMAMPGDPTTENLAKRISEWALDEWKLPVQVRVAETAVNAATYSILEVPGADQ